MIALNADLEHKLEYVCRNELPVINAWVKDKDYVTMKRRPLKKGVLGVSIVTIKFNHPQFIENVTKIRKFRTFCKENGIF